ncbi:MAG: hypothetical protein VCB59_11835 [Gammaproteobacteria bacterium]
MRDGIAIARNGLPAVALVTSKFWPQGDFVAKSEGMPDVPRVQLPHPVAGIGQAAMSALADEISEEVLGRLSDG